jgi:glucosylceramidase
MTRFASALLLVALVGCSTSESGAGSSPTPSPPGTTPPDAGADAGAPTADGSVPATDAGAPDTSTPGADAAPDAAPPSPPPPAAYLTTDDLSQALAAVPFEPDASGADATITLDPKTTYQSILGFGASITDSSSYVMKTHLSASALHDTLVKLFDRQGGIGLGFLRQPMGASDFSSVGNFSYDDADNDTSLASFAIDPDLKATIPILKQALAIEPDLFIMGTPWSAPAWMKLNSTMNGNGGGGGNSGLSGPAYEPYGHYFVKFIQAYAAQGVTVGAVTPQNEPLNGAAKYPGMDLNAPSELSLIADHMGPAFAAAGLSTMIWAYDHNWDVESYPETVIGDAKAGGFTEGAAFHCYGGQASAMSTFHQHFPQKSIYMTECSGGDWQGDPFAATIDLAIDSTANWARAVSLWNMALDDSKGPTNNGCSDCRGVITIDSGSGKVTYNADYYALGHFSKFVPRGAVRIGSTSSSDSVHQVAFRDPDGSVAIVLHNTGGSTAKVVVGSGATALAVSVPANAAVTITAPAPL